MNDNYYYYSISYKRKKLGIEFACNLSNSNNFKVTFKFLR